MKKTLGRKYKSTKLLQVKRKACNKDCAIVCDRGDQKKTAVHDLFE